MKLHKELSFQKPAGKPAGFFVRGLAAVLLAVWSATAAGGEISFFHLRLAEGELQVLSHVIRSGSLKASVEGNDVFQWDLTRKDGALARSGSFPVEERVEYPMEGGQIGSIETAPTTDWIVRTEAVREGGTLKLYRTPPGLVRQADRREFLGTAEVPPPASLVQMQSAPASKMVTLLTNGPSANRLNAVILAEGFRASEEALFLTNAVKVLNKLLGTPPYSSMRGYFNGFAIFVPSNESGADRPSQNIFRDTYFNASYETSGIDRLLTIPPNSFNSNFAEGRGRAFSLLQKHAPDYDLVMMLVNDTTYGGSGGTPALASLSPASADIIVHELGHSFAGLGDEYDSAASYPDTEEPNTTRETRRDFIKWKPWINSSTPIPTPETAAFSRVVGLFEGAHYHATGWFRPKLDCAMRTLGAPFCEVCSETLIVASYSRIDMLESVDPAPGSVRSTREDPARLAFQAIPGINNDVRFSWSVNGLTLAGAEGASLDFDSIYAAPGLHSVQLTAHDQTPAVRNDPLRRLVETSSWSVTVLSTGTPIITAHAIKAEHRLQFTSTHLATLVLEASANLADWAAIKTNTAALSLEQGVQEAGHEFYRVRAQPAF